MNQSHEPPTPELTKARRAVVEQLFPEQGYGFLTTSDARDVRFTRDSVLRDEFDELQIGSEVRYEEAEGASGPEASIVDLISIPLPNQEDGERLLGAEDEIPEMPSAFEEDDT